MKGAPNVPTVTGVSVANLLGRKVYATEDLYPTGVKPREGVLRAIPMGTEGIITSVTLGSLPSTASEDRNVYYRPKPELGLIVSVEWQNGITSTVPLEKLQFIWEEKEEWESLVI